MDVRRHTLSGKLVTGETALQSVYALFILRGLEQKPYYQGTVPRATKERRRAANKRARKARNA